MEETTTEQTRTEEARASDIGEQLRLADEGLDVLGRDCRIFPPPVERGEGTRDYCRGVVLGYSQDLVPLRVAARTYLDP